MLRLNSSYSGALDSFTTTRHSSRVSFVSQEYALSAEIIWNMAEGHQPYAQRFSWKIFRRQSKDHWEIDAVQALLALGNPHPSAKWRSEFRFQTLDSLLCPLRRNG